jgi:hypothetical protein
MTERKEYDPMQKVRELAARLVAEHEEEAARLSHERLRASEQAWEKSAAAVRRDAPEVHAGRDSGEVGRRKACLDAITAKLKTQGEALSPESSLLLSLLMKHIPGSWSEFDDDEITLEYARINPDTTITIAFAFYGSIVGEKTLPLRAS